MSGGTTIIGTTPDESILYPIIVKYCGNCTMPTEYCEYYPGYEQCKEWLEENLPVEFAQLMKEGGTEDGSDEKRRQKRGGKGVVKARKKEAIERAVTVFVAPRGKKKLTVVIGLKTFDIDLRAAAKQFGVRFACGASVTAEDEVVVQGDVKDDLIAILPEKWPQIDEESITDGGERKR